MLAIAATLAQSAPEKDERDTLRSAHVLHIMKASEADLRPIRSRLERLSGSQLVREFQRIARAESKDPGSAPGGGDLGLLEEGTMDAQFEAGYLALRPMQLSQPVKSAFGWHLVLVTQLNEQSVGDICRKSVTAVQGVVPIAPEALFALSRTPQTMSSLHPTILQYIGDGWSAPLNWNDSLAYMRREYAPTDERLVRVEIHTEYPFAKYGNSPQACRRSSRHVFQVDCPARTIAMVTRVEYEGRAATGRRLIEDVAMQPSAPGRPASFGLLAQIADFACKPGER